MPDQPLIEPPGDPEQARLVPGDPAPDFELPDADGQTVRLSEYRGRKAILYFFPAAMTPGCTTQATDFRDSLLEFDRLGIDVLGISPDRPEVLREFRDREGLSFKLLSDPQLRILYAYGAYGEKTLYGKTVRGVVRSTLVLDGRGVIERAYYNVRAKGHVARLKRDLGLA